MNILFVCKYNRFRSKIAEDYFNKINKNFRLKAKSAGIFEGSKISEFQKKIVRRFGIEIKEKPRGISTKLLKWQDCVVIVANDVPKDLFKENREYGKKLLIWRVPDAKEDSEKEVKKTIDRIKKNVRGFLKKLKWQ